MSQPVVIDGVEHDPLRLIKAVIAIDDEPLSAIDAEPFEVRWNKFNLVCADFLGFDEPYQMDFRRGIRLFENIFYVNISGEGGKLFLPLGIVWNSGEDIRKFKDSCINDLGFDPIRLELFVYSLMDGRVSGIRISNSKYIDPIEEIQEV